MAQKMAQDFQRMGPLGAPPVGGSQGSYVPAPVPGVAPGHQPWVMEPSAEFNAGGSFPSGSFPGPPAGHYRGPPPPESGFRPPSGSHMVLPPTVPSYHRPEVVGPPTLPQGAYRTAS